MPRPWRQPREMTAAEKEFVSRQVVDVEKRELSKSMNQVKKGQTTARDCARRSRSSTWSVWAICGVSGRGRRALTVCASACVATAASHGGGQTASAASRARHARGGGGPADA